MKKVMMILAAAALMVGCGGNNLSEQEQGLNLMKSENFEGEVDGKKVGGVMYRSLLARVCLRI